MHLATRSQPTKDCRLCRKARCGTGTGAHRQRGPLAALVSCEVERASKLLVTEWVIQLHKAYRALAQAGYASVCAPVSLAAHHGVCPASLGRKLAARQDKSNPHKI